MRTPSEILQLAKDDPGYLCGDHHNQNWLCSILSKLYQDWVITWDEYYRVRGEVEASLKTPGSDIPAVYLRTYLIVSGVIDESVRYNSPEYRVAAHAHWNKLIVELQAQGM